MMEKSKPETILLPGTPDKKSASLPRIGDPIFSKLTLPNQYKEKSLAILENPIDTNKTSDTTPYGGSSINNSPMPDTSIEFTVLGIGGFKMFQIFAVDNLPEPYKDKVVFQVKELKHSIVDNEWNTTVVCSVRPIHSIVDLFTV